MTFMQTVGGSEGSLFLMVVVIIVIIVIVISCRTLKSGVGNGHILLKESAKGKSLFCKTGAKLAACTT